MVKWNHAVVDLATNSTTVVAGPAWVLGIKVTRATSAHVCYLKDGTAEVLAIPESSPIGYNDSLEGTRFLTSLVVDPDDSATGQITGIYRAG
jgi:hypothetical protein